MRDEVVSLSPSYLKTVIIVEGRKSPLLRDARKFVFEEQVGGRRRTNTNTIPRENAHTEDAAIWQLTKISR